MKYYFFNPFSRQYLFPKGFKKIKLFESFYQPYTIKGKLLWWVWYYSFFVRNLCKAHEPERIVPINILKKYLSKDTVLAFNRGTLGAEQKISILGIDIVTGEDFFIKYANTELTIENVNNEGEILKQLVDLDFVPKLKQHVNEKNFTFIKTSVLKGERVTDQIIEKQILGVLAEIAELKVVVKDEFRTELKTCFAHGDFCPWNMMLYNNELQIYDWEMGRIQPVGYDLFTYIFQTSFLLAPSKDSADIISKNLTLINTYFNGQHIVDWKPYLSVFSSVKLKLETENNNQYLMSHYKELNTHVQEA